MKNCPVCGTKMERKGRPCPDGREGCAVFHFRYVCKNCETKKGEIMDLEQMRYEIDEELEEEERKEIRATAKKEAEKDYYRMAKWRQFVQNIKCIFGRHLYNRIPSLGITTCPCCTRIWNTPYKGLRTVVNGSLVGYGDFEQSRSGEKDKTWLKKGETCEDEQKD